MRPHRLQQSETRLILDRANRFLAVTKVEQQAGLSTQSTTAQRWIVILFVQIYASSSHNDIDTETEAEAVARYLQLVEQQISASGGYIVGEWESMALAMFIDDSAKSVVQTGIDTAVKLMNRLTAENKERLAQDLVPLRVGIGLDSSAIPLNPNLAQMENRSRLEACIRQARNLCDLNRQTPFPAIFISQNIAACLNGQQHYTVQNLGDVTVPRSGELLAVYALMPDVSKRR